MIKYFQFLFAVLFSVLILFIFILSFVVWTSNTKISQTDTKLPQPPATINLEKIDTSLPRNVQEQQLKIYKTKIDLYLQQVTIYAQELNSYKTFIESQQANTDGHQRLQLYNSVIKDNLATLLSTLITVIIAYAFARQGLELYEKYLQQRKAS